MLTNKVFTTLCSYLDEKHIVYRQVQHQATYTSEESSLARGEDLSIDGKALLMKVDDQFHLFVLSAARKCDSKKIKERFNAKKLRFANNDELFQLTELVPGSVPPFGRPILPFDLFVDESIVKNEKIAFNAGLLTESVVMQVADYLAIVNAQIFSFSTDR
jgi:Ala-tRNA(Pro) deacylase